MGLGSQRWRCVEAVAPILFSVEATRAGCEPGRRDRLQYVLHVGHHVRLRERVGDFVVHFVARTAYDYVTYLVADETLWVSERR